MTALLLAIGVCSLVSAVAVLILDWLRPQASEIKLAVIAGLLPGLVMTLLLVLALISEAHHIARPDEVDRGLVFPTMLAVTPLLVIPALFVGFIAASVTLRWRRRHRPG